MTTNDQRPAERDATLSDYAAMFWRKGLVIVGGAAVLGGIAAVVSSGGPDRYEAMVTFSAAQSRLSEQQNISGMPPNTTQFRPFVENLSVAAQVVDELKLGMRPADFLDALNIQEIRGTSLITVKVSMADPVMAAKAANSVGKFAMENARRVNASDVAYTRDVIKGQVESARAELDAADVKYRDYRKQARIETLRKDIEARLGGPQSPAVIPFPSPSAIPSYNPLAGTVTSPSITVDASSGRTSLLDVTSRIAAARARAASFERDMAARLKANSSAASDESYRALDASAAQARAELAGLEQQRTAMTTAFAPDAATTALLDRLYTVEGELAKRQIDRQVAERMLTTLSQRYQDAVLQVMSRTSDLIVIDQAVPDDRPASKHVARNVVVVVSIWLLLAAAGLLMLESVNRRRRAQ